MESSQKKNVKVALIGATGAIGKEIIRWAKNESLIEELSLIVRKRLEEWKDEDFKCKLRVIELPDMDDMSALKEQLQGYDIFLCTLGTRVKVGEELFKKVDMYYPIEFGKIGLEGGAKYYGLLSSTGASASSWFLYMKTKGQAENAIKALGYPYTCIFRPGLLKNRDNDARVGEKIMQFLKLGPQIEAVDVGKVLLYHGIETVLNPREELKSVLMSNDDMLNYSRLVNERFPDAKYSKL